MSFSAERQKVLEMLGFFWTRVFLDSDFVDKYATTIAVQFQDLNEYVELLPDYLSRQLLPVTQVQDSRIFVFNESDLDRDAAKYGDGNHVYGDGLAYGQQLTVLNEWRYPIEPDYRPSFLAVDLLDPKAILQLDVHYTIRDNVITFQEDPLKLAGLRKYPTVVDDEIEYGFLLWGFSVHEDVQAVNNFFGIVGGVAGDSSPHLKEAMNIAWDLRTEGASVRNIIRMLSYVTNTDYVSLEGKVLDIYTESDRVCVLTDTAVYTAPLGSQVLPHVVPGLVLQPADMIFDTFVLRTGRDVLDFEDFEGLTLGPGYVSQVAPHGLFFQNTEVPVIQERHPDFFDFVAGP